MKTAGDLSDRDIGCLEKSADGLDFFGRELCGAPSLSAASASGFETGDGPLADQIAFKLSKRGKDMEDEPTGGGDGLDLLSKRFEVDLPLLQVGDQSDKIGEVAAQPIEPPNHESVALSQALEAAFELRPAGVLSTGLLFVYLSALGVLECVSLQIESLIVRRDTSVADAHVPDLIKALVFRTEFSGQVVRHF